MKAACAEGGRTFPFSEGQPGKQAAGRSLWGSLKLQCAFRHGMRDAPVRRSLFPKTEGSGEHWGLPQVTCHSQEFLHNSAKGLEAQGG